MSLSMRQRLRANPNRCFPVLYFAYDEDARPFPVTFPHVHVFSRFAAAIPPIMYCLLETLALLNVALEAALLLLVRQSISDYNCSGHHYGSADTMNTVGSSIS